MMDTQSNINTYFADSIPRIEDEIQRVLNSPTFTSNSSGLSALHPALFNTMLNYHLGFANADGTPTQVYSGKRIRPVLTLLSCEACDGDIDDALPAAAAIELLHNFSLIHDDIEDRDELRRGRPTVWKLWGIAQAINAGDAMFSMAHLAIERLRERDVPATRILHALRAFDETAVALTVGQHLDLSFETRSDVSVNEYMTMIQGKTGALIKTACSIGAIVAGAPAERSSALGSFGAWLGIAFQLQDDVLGIWGDPERTGKQDSDLLNRKKTLPVLYAAEKNQRVHDLYFGHRALTDQDIVTLKQLIEDCNGRTYTQQAAAEAFARSLDALDAAHLSGRAGQILHDLANSLVSRES